MLQLGWLPLLLLSQLLQLQPVLILRCSVISRLPLLRLRCYDNSSGAPRLLSKRQERVPPLRLLLLLEVWRIRCRVAAPTAHRASAPIVALALNTW